MKKYLLPEKCNFYKANLHCHSNVSDGLLSPGELKELYKSRGYSVLAYTDHDILIPHNDLTDDTFVALSGFEAQFNEYNRYPGRAHEKKCHICFISPSAEAISQPCWHEDYAYIGNVSKYRCEVVADEGSSPYVREYSPESINKMISIAREKGFFITYNHPAWSLENWEQYMKYDGMHAMEIFNNGAEMLGYQSYASYVYDDMLKGGKKVFAVAADDTHNGKDDAFGGFVMICAKELKYESITNALLNGNFYASTGPEIYELFMENGKIYIKSSPAVKISLTTDCRMSRCITAKDGDKICEAEFEIDMEKCKYFKITVKDERGNYADTNAYFVEDL